MSGQVVGDMLSAFGNPMGPTMPATSSAATPDNAKSAKRKTAETDAIQDARKSLWVAATIIVVSIVVLGFGSKFLNNVRIA